jgi:hypothetical protein
MLLGDDHGMSADDLDKFADVGVDTFLAAYAASAYSAAVRYSAARTCANPSGVA